MNEYLIFFNGTTWTCEIEDEEGNIIDYATGNTPSESLQNALKIEGQE